MATYNKRGHKAPKPKEVEEEVIDAGDSTTQEVFDSLDESASRTEEWIAGNQNLILSIIGAIAIATAGYLLFNKFVTEPKEEAASIEMAQSQQYFNEAIESTVANDSLYTLALNGSGDHIGFLNVIKQYGGTKAGSLANYYAGISYLKLKKYTEAITHLEQFSSDDEILNTVALGAIGDAFSEIGQNAEALKFYGQAIDNSDNEFVKPIYLLKAGQAALAENDKATALKHFTTISESYKKSNEAKNIQAFIGLAL